MAAVPTYPASSGPINPDKLIVNADSTNIIDVFTNSDLAANRIKSLKLCSTDTVARDITFYRYKDGVSFALGTVSVPAGSGMDSTNLPVDVLEKLGTFDSDDLSSIWIEAGSKLQVKAVVAIAATKEVALSLTVERYI